MHSCYPEDSVCIIAIVCIPTPFLSTQNYGELETKEWYLLRRSLHYTLHFLVILKHLLFLMPVFPILRSKVHILHRFLKIFRRRASACRQLLEALIQTYIVNPHCSYAIPQYLVLKQYQHYTHELWGH